MKKLLVSVVVSLITVGMLFGCSASPSEYAGYDQSFYGDGEVSKAEAPQESAIEVEEAESQSSGLNYEGSILEPGVERKIIFEGNFHMRTKAFDADYESLMAMLKEMGGYIESSSVSGKKPVDWHDSGRYATMTLRIPSKNFDRFVGRIGELGETVSSSIRGTDVSLQYFDTETRLKTLRTREERLLALLEQATGLEAIVELEKELANVSYEIQMHETQLRDYDSLIDYSTVSIDLQEVNQVEQVRPSDESLGSRISNAFFSVLNAVADFGEFMLVLLIGGAPVIIPLGVVLWLVLFLVRRKKKKMPKKDNTQQ